MCKLILANAVDKNPKLENGWTALHLAAQNDHVEVVKLIFANILEMEVRRRRLLQLVSYEGPLSKYRWLFEKNPKIEDGWTLFHLAAFYGDIEVCELIIENVNYKNPKNG